MLSSSKPHLNLLRLKDISIIDQLCLEEALLRTDNEQWCILNENASPAIVMGISGKPELLINQEHLEKHPIPVIRRFSGGGTVVIDENTCFATFICNREPTGVACYPDKVFQWSQSFYTPVFSGINFSLRENDYVIGERKFGGNAQYMRKDRWLHHTSFLWDYAPQRMDYLHLPSKMPGYRNRRSHLDFLCKLEEHFPHKEMFFERIIARLHEVFSVANVTLNASLRSELLERSHRKATIRIS